MDVIFDSAIFIRGLFDVRINYEKIFSIPENTIFKMPTFVYVEVIQPRKDVAKELERNIVVQELYRVNSVQDLKIIHPTKRTFEIYKELQLFRSGKHLKSKSKQHFTIGTIDMWIASICFENNCHLFTVDKDFEKFTPFFPVTNVSIS